MSLLAQLVSLWRTRRKQRKEAALNWIKARYHIFRVLLANNERALEAMAEADRLLAENEPSRLPATVLDLRDTVLELIDGLNRLTGNAHVGLYPRLGQIERALDAALDSYASAPRRKWLDLAEVRPDMREQAGGKAQPLGGLIRAGLPVPAGVCITRRSCREYLRRAKLEDRLAAILREAASTKMDGDGGPDLNALAARARTMIAASAPDQEFAAELRAAWEHLAGGAPLSISVRSSASSEDGGEHSFAGQYTSVLGVRSPEALVEAFKTVLASAFSARALAYRALVNRSGAGLSGESVDMAVLCQRMVDARASGVLFTVDPTDTGTPGGTAEGTAEGKAGRMLLTAVPGLGTQAVSGRAPADVFRPSRDPRVEDMAGTPAEIAEKTVREVPAPAGGLTLQEVSGPERMAPLLSPDEIKTLRDHALRIEALAGRPQDIEWSVDHAGRIWILQARPAKLAHAASQAQAAGAAAGVVLLSGGVSASPGKAAGKLAIVRTREDLDTAAKAPRPVVLALHQSMVDAASLVPEAAALLVDMGNPLDHLAGLSRELGIPMITGLGEATTALTPGDWVLADADQGRVVSVDPLLWQNAPRPAPRPAAVQDDAALAVRGLVLPLNLTDAYGPTFSILEAKSLHDLVRYTHEKAVMALFEAGDAIAEQTFTLVHRLKDPAGLLFLIIDLGGGLAPGCPTEVAASDILSAPLAALCRGMATPGLRWGTPPPIAGLSGLMTRGFLDARSERPVGNPNYALVARDYLNLNARVDYHFALVDSVCGANPRENSIRFRFKGGGTVRIQRERRAVFVEQVLRAQEFFTTRQGDMVTAVLTEGSRETILAKLEMLGRFLGFSRLLDAVMVTDDMPRRVAEAFLSGDYALDGLSVDVSSAQ
ncbi:MAG: PEP/pyruvate-binding domain-containing protein [Humidesulfovibrio sp.]|nr:PEP/pyruvate-binding domain-containing protein [Humidesulfovibrio sp.]